MLHPSILSHTQRALALTFLHACITGASASMPPLSATSAYGPPLPAAAAPVSSLRQRCVMPPPPPSPLHCEWCRLLLSPHLWVSKTRGKRSSRWCHLHLHPHLFNAASAFVTALVHQMRTMTSRGGNTALGRHPFRS